MIDILLCSVDKEKTAAFYRIAGLELIEEQHGDGPQHFSFSKQITPEIYPPRATTPEANFIIRITVNDIEDIMQQLNVYFPEQKIIAAIHALKSGKKSIVHDPDGRVVEFFQPFNF